MMSDGWLHPQPAHHPPLLVMQCVAPKKLSWEAKAHKAKICHAKKMSQPMWAAHEARSPKRKGAAAMRQNEPDCFCCAVSSLSGKIKSSEDCWGAGGCGVALWFEPARLSHSSLLLKYWKGEDTLQKKKAHLTIFRCNSRYLSTLNLTVLVAARCQSAMHLP